MPSRKQQMKDITSYFPKKNVGPASSCIPSEDGPQPGGATDPKNTAGHPCIVKEENDTDSTVQHLHQLIVKFDRDKCHEYTINCHQPCTVLELLTSKEKFRKMIKCPDEKIIIQLGKKDRESVIATHFPCSCIEDGESLIISFRSERIEHARADQHDKVIHPREKYSVFYIDREGGVNTKTKELFRSNAVKQFKHLCVYGKKGMTVKNALERDGRFINYLGNYALSDNENPTVLTDCTETVDNLDQKVFKICLPLNKRESYGDPGASLGLQVRRETRSILEVAKQSGISVKRAVEEKGTSNTEEIYERLRQQFPDLKKWMEERIPGDSYQNALSLSKECFGKIQQSFSEVHRVEKLLNLGKSVCKVIVKDLSEGTGFVLFDNFILTNAHLFQSCTKGEKLQEDIDVLALFNYDDPEPETNFYYFFCKKQFTDFDGELDYAILELNPEGQKPNQKKNAKKINIPPGLLKKFGPVPLSGEACIIGHPAGGVKRFDPTCIIEISARVQAVNDHIHRYTDSLLVVHNLMKVIQDEGITNIMMGGNNAENVVTYNTFMYHGSSGSPVFDAHCQVFGLHSAGYCFKNHNVMEFAYPLLSIFKTFVSNLKKKSNETLLIRVNEVAKGNKYLEEALKAEPAETDELMEVS